MGGGTGTGKQGVLGYYVHSYYKGDFIYACAGPKKGKTKPVLDANERKTIKKSNRLKRAKENIKKSDSTTKQITLTGMIFVTSLEGKNKQIAMTIDHL
jgi:ribosomal protein L24